MTTCLYLPDGRVAFMYGRPRIADNKAMNAGGMKFEVVEPFKKLKVSYDGKAVVLDRPFDMAEPSKAFRENPMEHRSRSRGDCRQCKVCGGAGALAP